MVLVDSSVWILKYDEAGLRVLLQDEIATCPPIIEEVLRGTRSEESYHAWLADFSTMATLDSPMPLETFEQAAQIYRACRAGGATIRSPYDCLIAACAIRNDAELLHADHDFEQIARFTALKQRNLADLTPSA